MCPEYSVTYVPERTLLVFSTTTLARGLFIIELWGPIGVHFPDLTKDLPHVPKHGPAAGMLTISEAKKAPAATLGLKLEEVEITIGG